MAPGVGIFSTYPGGYRSLSGTSMATPWAAGVVALMMAKHRKVGGKTPLNTVEDVREHLIKTAVDLEQAGKDTKTGYGLVDVTKALETITPPDPEPIPETPDPIEENPMPIQDLSTKIAEFVAKYEEKELAVGELQAQLDALKAELTAMNEKATQIQNLLA